MRLAYVLCPLITNKKNLFQSYIVAVKFIEIIEGNMLKVLGEKIPIGRSYKNDLLDRKSIV